MTTQAKAESLLAELLQAAKAADPAVMVNRPGVSATVTRKARGLLRQRPDDRALLLAAFMRGLSHRSARVRFECAHALDAFGDVSTRGPLIALIDDPVPRVRRMAVHALTCDACGENLIGGDIALEQRIADLALSDPSLQVRRHATWALSSTLGEAAREALQTALADVDAVVRRNAAAALRHKAADRSAAEV